MSEKPTPVPVPAIVLAGGKTGPEFAAAAGIADAPGNRALADINGSTMVGYVVRALQRSAAVSRVIVVAPPAFPVIAEADEMVYSNVDLVGNIEAGLASCTGDEFALLVTADIPFLTPEAVDDYVQASWAANVDCVYAAIPEDACRRSFPELVRTYLRTPEGSFTGGNIVFQRVTAFAKQGPILREARERRKNPAYLVRLIGPGNVLRFATRTLTLDHIGAAASRLLKVQCKVLSTPWAELGSDIDKPEDLVIARRMLSRQ